jgi:hypothetical protein
MCLQFQWDFPESKGRLIVLLQTRILSSGKWELEGLGVISEIEGKEFY